MSRLRYDAILFDLDGTLADSAADIALALRRSLADLGIATALPIESFVDGSPLEEIFALAVPSGDAALYDRFVARYRSHYGAIDHESTRLYPGVLDTLDALRMLSPRPKLAVATSKRADSAHHLCAAMGIARFFDFIDGSGATSLRPKPAPDLPLRVSAALDVSPSRALMVGDTARDIQAGRAAGMQTAAVLYGLGTREALRDAAPDHMLEDIEEVISLVSARS